MKNSGPEKGDLICCVGNNLATLIGAYEMAKIGYSVKLFSDNGSLGGFFSGLSIGGYDFDLGLILVEKFEENDKNDRKNVDKRSAINSWLTLGEEVSRWLDDQIGLHMVDTPEVFIFGKKFPDYIISNRLDFLENSGVQSAQCLDFDSRYHASNKESGEIYDEVAYVDASEYNHGKDFHVKCIEPFIRKVTSFGSDKFLARYHRFSWAPLYYPETLNLAIKGQIVGLKECHFWTTSTGFVGDLVRKVKREISMMSNIEVIEKRLSSINLQDNYLEVDGNRYQTDHKILLGLSMDRTLELLQANTVLAGDSDGVNFTIGLALVHRDAVDHGNKCIFIVDDEFASYRVTNQDVIAGLDPEWHRISIEANSDILQNRYSELSLEEAIEKDLSRFMRIEDDKHLKILKVINVKNGLYLPSKKFVERKRFLSNSIASLTGGHAVLTGDLVEYGASSINNQIMQGLNYKEELL